MTGEEIKQQTIEQLERISEKLVCIGEKYDWTEYAIEALEREPCKRCVSFDDIREMLTEIEIAIDNGEGFNYDTWRDKLENLPLVRPQEPFLDLIREEIENTYLQMPSNYNHRQRTIFYEEVIKIIDKYKAESEK